MNFCKPLTLRILMFTFIMIAPTHSMAEPHYYEPDTPDREARFYGATTRERVAQFTRAPSTIEVNRGSSHLLWAEPPILTYADIMARYVETVKTVSDLASSTDLAQVSKLAFLAYWSGTPVSPAPPPRDAVSWFTHSIPVEQLRILASKAATDEAPHLGPLAVHLADAKWSWNESRLEIRDEDYVIWIKPVAWLNDRRDGADKLMIEMSEDVPSATYHTTFQLIIAFENEKAVEFEVVSSFLAAMQDGQ